MDFKIKYIAPCQETENFGDPLPATNLQLEDLNSITAWIVELLI